MVEGRLPTVIEYYQEYINRDVNLASNPKQCCPFHQENTPSFSYNIKTGRWTCFGKCHASGDVIEMHRRWFKLDTKEEAEQDLCAKYHVTSRKTLEQVANESSHYVSESDVRDQVTYAKAIAMANTPDRWLELDHLMSKSPFDRVALQILMCKWQGIE